MKRKSTKELEYIDKDGVKYVTKIATKNPGSCSNCDFIDHPNCSSVIRELKSPCLAGSWEDNQHRIFIKAKKQPKKVDERSKNDINKEMDFIMKATMKQAAKIVADHINKNIKFDINDIVEFNKAAYTISAVNGIKEYYILTGFKDEVLYIPFTVDYRLIKVGVSV